MQTLHICRDVRGGADDYVRATTCGLGYFAQPVLPCNPQPILYGLWSYGSVEERSVHTGKVAGSIPARTTVYPQPQVMRLGVL